MIFSFVFLRFLFLSLILLFPISGHSQDLSEEAAVQRIQAHLLIKDPDSACSEAKSALKTNPKSKILWEAYLKALANAGQEKEMLATWKSYSSFFENAVQNREIVEAMAWSVIAAGSSSQSPIIRLHALLGAFFGQDNKGVEIICRYFKDNNAILRNGAIQLSSHLRDAKLGEGVLKLFNEEKNLSARLEAIKAVGKMHLHQIKPDLLAIIANDKSSADEKVAAIQSLVAMLDSMDSRELTHLATSNRTGLRLLACKVVENFQQETSLECIFPLLNDHSSEVRAAVLQVIGLLRIKEFQGKSIADISKKSLGDPNPSVAMSAAWVLTLIDPEQGQRAFSSWLTHQNPQLRIQASAALHACGKYAFPLAQKAFYESTDPYVKMNLALLLIEQRVDIEQACQNIFQELTLNKDRWRWEEFGIFNALTSSRLAGNDEIESPEAENQIARLDLLNILAMMQYQRTQEAIIHFLHQRSWGIAGMSSVLLLKEGNEEALELVQNLLNDSQHNVRVQAALILALWGREENAIATLQAAYHNSSRDMKERILEGIGRVGAQSSIPFLVERLSEPSQILRIIAASALLQCLYS